MENARAEATGGEKERTMFNAKKLNDLKMMTGILTCFAVLGACDDGTGPDLSVDATVEGRVEETTPPASAPSGSSPQSASATSAQTAAVVQIQADGSFMELATADVEASGSFMIQDVPAGRSDLAVVVYADGDEVGSVMLHEQSRAGVTIVAAPIDGETTLQTRTYTRVRASSSGGASSSSEVSLLVRADGLAAESAAASETELQASATAYATASAAMTAAYEMRGTALDASTRGTVLADAAVTHASNLYTGTSSTVANRLFIEAALEAFIDAGADLESTVMASASAASTFDAALESSSSIRGELDVQPIHLNLLARERLAARYASETEGAVAVAIEDVIADARASLSLGLGLIDLRALIDGALTAVVDVGADACVSLLAADASSTVQAEVRARAEEAFEAARLDVRLQSATTAEAAASAMAGYRADVRAAVDAMIAASGATDVDADVMTSLFIAASGGAYIR